jgi:hypothetical protein
MNSTVVGAIVLVALVIRIILDVSSLTSTAKWLNVAYSGLFVIAGIVIIAGSDDDIFGYLSLAIGIGYFGLFLWKRIRRDGRR